MRSPTRAAGGTFRSDFDAKLRRPPKAPGSAADLGHRSARAHEARIADPVLQLLVPHGEPDVPLELVVGRSRPEHGLQVPLAPGEETGAELAVGRDSDPVARRAERLRDGV